jgi:Leucine-rich repeat (LRR) protein
VSQDNISDAKDRLHELGVSVAHGGRSFPDDARNGKGHLSIHTSGYKEASLDQILPILHDLVETFELKFTGSVADEHLRHLVGLQNILSLELNHTQITDAGLRHLAGLTSLRILELRGLPITAIGIRHLAGLPHLSELDLWQTRVEDDALEVMSQLTELTVLKLTDCPVTDRGLEKLASLTKLRTLDLSGTQVQGPGLVVLRQLPELWSLDLEGLPLRDRDVELIRHLSKLHSLDLDNTRVGDEGANWLAGLPALHWLALSGTQIGDDALRHIASCRELWTLTLSRTSVTGAGLAQLPDLASLRLTGLNLSEADIANLGHLQSLRTLTLDERILNEAIITRLRQMHLGRCQTYDEGVAGFARLPTCPLCKGVIDEGASTYYARPFAMDAEFFSLVEQPIHWDCYACWEQRPQFARQYFQANVAAMQHNQFWGMARCDDRVMLTINPGQYVREIEVLLAETGSAFRISMNDWQDWLDGEWFEGCRHEVEREALAPLITAWKEELPTPEALAEAAGLRDGEQEVPQTTPMVERITYEFACENLARRAASKGMACPHCSQFSNDYEYRRVASVSLDGPQSCLFCKACEKEFGPDEA